MAIRLPDGNTLLTDSNNNRVPQIAGQSQEVCTYSPVLRAADLPTINVPSWGGRRLRFEVPPGKRK